MDVVGRNWCRILSEIDGDKHAKAIQGSYSKCPSKATYADKFHVEFQCQKGPKADEHFLIIIPK